MTLSIKKLLKKKFGKLRLRPNQNINQNTTNKVEWDCNCGGVLNERINTVVSGHIKTCGKCSLITAAIIAKRKFGKLRVKVPQDMKPGSGKKVECICDCGNETDAIIKNLFSENTTSCGRCTMIPASKIAKRKFGKLRIKNPVDILPGSGKKIECICDCKKTVFVRVIDLFKNHITSCGKCNLITVEEMKTWKRYKLRMKYPKDILPGSNKKEWWICDCENEVSISISAVCSGHTQSCGKCNLITAEEMAGKPYGDLVIEVPQDIKPGSGKKIGWICKCGRTTLASPYNVLNEFISSCGKCKLITAAVIAKKKYGKLRIETPQDVLPGSERKIWWICDCEQRVKAPIYNVVSGHKKSCGKCYESIQDWYLKYQHVIKSLKCPISMNDIPSGCIKPLEVIVHTKKPFPAICFSCKQVYYPIWSDIRQGKSFTCGCTNHKISNACKEIEHFFKLHNIDIKFEYTVNNLDYDIFILSHNLLIEYNGLKWHSYSKSKEKDLKKYQNAINNGYDYLMIFEDEWIHNKEKIKSLLLNKLSVMKSSVIRSNKCEIKIVSSKEANMFHEQFHYIGKCRPKLSYGVFYNLKLISVISFSRPTRQTSKYQWELVRMASDPAYKVHGIWSKLLKKFIAENSPTSIVSFSDNRLFSGAVYEKIGFKYDGLIPSDYYWVKGTHRHHKSALRKTKEEKLTGLTETQLREAHGYKKIWDLGKKRWVYHTIALNPSDMII
jgi:hypothetical protein